VLGLNQGQLLLIGGGVLALAGYLLYRFGLPRLKAFRGDSGAIPTREQAFTYATGLEAYHASKQCVEGAKAAREAGKFLFDAHHTGGTQ